MSTKTEKELEQKYLDNVIDKVKQAEQKAEEKIKTAQHDIKGINKQIDDIHLNTTTYSGMMDTAMSFRAQQQMLDERQNCLFPSQPYRKQVLRIRYCCRWRNEHRLYKGRRCLSELQVLLPHPEQRAL